MMATKRFPRPRDPISLAKLIGDIATGQVVDAVEDKRDRQAATIGRKGGAARARSLTAEERSEAAALAAQARWKKSSR
jgi:ubiquinone biosynthesis protein UbiJ